MEHPGHPAWGRDKSVLGVRTTCARGQREEARLFRRHRETLDLASPS